MPSTWKWAALALWGWEKIRTGEEDDRVNFCRRAEASEGGFILWRMWVLGGNLGRDDGRTGGHCFLVREIGTGRSGLPELKAWQLCKCRCCLTHFALFCWARSSRKGMYLPSRN